jgi:hypothetical protein
VIEEAGAVGESIIAAFLGAPVDGAIHFGEQYSKVMGAEPAKSRIHAGQS